MTFPYPSDAIGIRRDKASSAGTPRKKLSDCFSLILSFVISFYFLIKHNIKHQRSALGRTLNAFVRFLPLCNVGIVLFFVRLQLVPQFSLSCKSFGNRGAEVRQSGFENNTIRNLN